MSVESSKGPTPKEEIRNLSKAYVFTGVHIFRNDLNYSL